MNTPDTPAAAAAAYLEAGYPEDHAIVMANLDAAVAGQPVHVVIPLLVAAIVQAGKQYDRAPARYAVARLLRDAAQGLEDSTTALPADGEPA